ncbi:cobalamin biosynthesis protein CobD [Suicoccus acidiformans]|uniref:Cobalamin biosynthesis protein CobD n=1 Tax=Suicoccus acidiformans TaxID=2036206 RepID=A0A347WLX6_9LACT|nr:adenosylcobinamide-phosphate synthase CbiB [Suicoccus acidiformans]AXY26083.1 cobalamin biosynthesis protein CobD [Suicoccus acidiformans]
MHERIIFIVIAYCLDLCIGDPYSWPHPVKLMGNYIVAYQRWTLFRYRSPSIQFCLGIILWLSMVSLTVVISAILLYFANWLHAGLGILVEIYIIYSCFSVKSLAYEARKVAATLETEGLDAGCHQVSRIVGRETQRLTEEGVIHATVETVAENTSDGFIAPLLYVLLLGPIGGLVYKAVNTLDSMVAYRNETFEHFGKFSAWMDDLFNYVPARITGLLIVVSSFLISLDGMQAWRIMKRDHAKHKSPNAGYPEAAIAGALGIQLGGGHYYHGQWVEKPTIGDTIRNSQTEDITQTIRILYITSALAIIFVIILFFILGG